MDLVEEENDNNQKELDYVEPIWNWEGKYRGRANNDIPQGIGIFTSEDRKVEIKAEWNNGVEDGRVFYEWKDNFISFNEVSKKKRNGK